MARNPLAAVAPALLYFACACACVSARASDYRFELEFLVEEQDTEFISLDITGSGATVYFREITDEGQQPVPERAFLQRVGYVEASVGNLELERKFAVPPALTYLDGQTSGGSFRFSGPGSPVALAGSFRYSVFPDIVYTFPFPGSNSLEVINFDAELWFFLGAYSALSFGGGGEIVEEMGDVPSEFFRTTEERFHVRFKTVRPLAPPRWVNLEFGAGFSELDDDNPFTPELIRDEIFFRFDVYPLPTIGFGGGLVVSFSDDSPNEEGMTFEARLTLNAGSNVGLSATYEHFEPRDQNLGNEDRIAVQFVARF